MVQSKFEREGGKIFYYQSLKKQTRHFATSYDARTTAVLLITNTVERDWPRDLKEWRRIQLILKDRQTRSMEEAAKLVPDYTYQHLDENKISYDPGLVQSQFIQFLYG